MRLCKEWLPEAAKRGYKAAFEAFITVKDQAESAKLQKFAGALQDIENNLPIDPKYRNPKLGALAPIAVLGGLALIVILFLQWRPAGIIADMSQPSIPCASCRACKRLNFLASSS